MTPEEYKRKCKELNDDLDGCIWGVLGVSVVIGICAIIALIIDKLS